MLESHNDSAVAIAECIAGNVDKFADMMNKKASQLGCNSTYFITPNGLDGQDENGIHHTTAEELARIMRYCIMESPQKEKFLEITRADAYTFTDCKGEKSYSCVNHNTFLKMMDGALSGKTGFTQDAGYCYVGALRKDGKTLIVALLACGWPNNKGYKWSDTKKLMTYGMENYCYKEISPDKIDRTEKIYIKNGYTGGFPKKGKDLLEVEILGESKKILVGADDKDEIEIKIKKEICAPIKKGTVIGEIVYRVNGERIISYEVVAGKTVKERTLWICAEYLRRKFLL
jgi:D-alanyl-D-alanine carboxypeptidase (penicillin-binding protein 5/6)